MNWLLWFGLIVATARVTRLLVKDEFPPTRVVREWFIQSFARHNAAGELAREPSFGPFAGLMYSIAYIWTCPWCMSVWVSAGLWWIAVWAGFSVPLPWLMMAAASLLAGWLGSWDERIEQSYKIAEQTIAKLEDDAERRAP